MKRYLFFSLLVLLVSCSLFKTKYVDEPPAMMVRSGILSPNIFRYNLDFPEKNIEVYRNVDVRDNFSEGGLRFGKIIKGTREGKWLSGDAGFDKNGNVYDKGGIWREEYFKNDLRDSIFRQFDVNDKIIYETTFKMGTGLWKEFHDNGTLYFEIYTKDGYFTDTLRLHDDKGKIIGKRLYVKDSLIYDEGLPCFPYRPDSVRSD